MTRIKICCIASREEADLAIRCGATAIGLVSEMPSGPGVIDENRITEIATTAPPAVGTFLLTCKQDADEIVAQQKRCRTNTIQLCDRLLSGTHAQLRDELPGIAIVQVIHVQDESSIEEAISIAPQVNAILLDSGNQNLEVKQLGGTGRRHDWQLSRQIRDAITVPIFLAGGITPSNAAQAIQTVRPYALDICTGVRTNGSLDEQKLTTLMNNVRATS